MAARDSAALRGAGRTTLFGGGNWSYAERAAAPARKNARVETVNREGVMETEGGTCAKWPGCEGGEKALAGILRSRAPVATNGKDGWLGVSRLGGLPFGTEGLRVQGGVWQGREERQDPKSTTPGTRSNHDHPPAVEGPASDREGSSGLRHRRGHSYARIVMLNLQS